MVVYFVFTITLPSKIHDKNRVQSIFPSFFQSYFKAICFRSLLPELSHYFFQLFSLCFVKGPRLTFLSYNTPHTNKPYLISMRLLLCTRKFFLSWNICFAGAFFSDLYLTYSCKWRSFPVFNPFWNAFPNFISTFMFSFVFPTTIVFCLLFINLHFKFF